MIPVDQEFISDPSIGQYGDCQRAVIASLLSLPISDVPHFLKDAGGDADLFWQGMQSFLARRGYTLLDAGRHWNFFGADGIDVYHEISGPSPRGNGLFHAVVGCNGQVVFDPHPSRAGLAGDPNEWRHGYLVSIAQGGAPAIAPPVAAGSGHDVCRDSERFYRQNCLVAIERAEKAEARVKELEAELDIELERAYDRLLAARAAKQASRQALQAEGKHPAPCARDCEANAFQIEVRRLQAVELNMHRKLAAEKLRADQGWARYEAAMGRAPGAR